jgi:hypothetical protein
MSIQHTRDVAILTVEAMESPLVAWGSAVTPPNSPSLPSVASSSDSDSASLFTWVEDDHCRPFRAQRQCPTSPTDSFVSVDLDVDIDTVVDERTPLLPGRRAREEGEYDI